MNRPLVPYRPPDAEQEAPPVLARVMDNSPDELQLRPVDCPSRDEILMHNLVQELAQAPPEAPPARFRFSVFDMLVVTFAISVGLAGGKWMPAGVFALLITTRQYVGEPISCWCPVHFSGSNVDYANKVYDL